MSALDMLSQKNGLKKTQSVLKKQQSGVDAAQKANPQQPTFTMKQLDAMKSEIDKQNAAVPSDPDMKAAREKTIATQQAIANGVDVNQGVDADDSDKPAVPIVKKEEPKPQPKQLSYADMFKAIYGNGDGETEEQKERREKRERRNMRIAAIGDGLRALSNMYFATKGAKVAHDPNSDMTPIMLKRKQMVDQQREKNKSAWLNGYLKAQALDEEARKNNLTLAEQMRYHDMTKENNDMKNELSKLRIAQGDRRLDLSEFKINSDADYKNFLKELKEKELAGKVKHWQAIDAAASARARRSGRSKATKEDYDAAWLDLYGNDPKGAEKAQEDVADSGLRPTPKRSVIAYRKNKAKASSKGGGKHRNLNSLMEKWK